MGRYDAILNRKPNPKNKKVDKASENVKKDIAQQVSFSSAPDVVENNYMPRRLRRSTDGRFRGPPGDQTIRNPMIASDIRDAPGPSGRIFTIRSPSGYTMQIPIRNLNISTRDNQYGEKELVLTLPVGYADRIMSDVREALRRYEG